MNAHIGFALYELPVKLRGRQCLRLWVSPHRVSSDTGLFTEQLCSTDCGFILMSLTLVHCIEDWFWFYRAILDIINAHFRVIVFTDASDCNNARWYLIWSLSRPCNHRKPAVASGSQPTFSCGVVHAFRRAADINFLVEVRLCVWAAAVFVGTISPVSLSGRRPANWPHFGAHIPPCALLHYQLRSVPGVGRSAGAQTAPVARLPLRFSCGAPDSSGQTGGALDKLTSLRQHHHLLSAFHHKHDFKKKCSQEPSKPRRWFSGWRGVCVVMVGGGIES